MEAVLAQLASINPLCLGARDYMLFQHWRLQTPDYVWEVLESELTFMKQAFESWRADPISTPGLWTKLDVERCLALNPKAKVKHSESTDTYHISALPYVDVLFADGQIHDAVQKSNLPEEWKLRCRPNSKFESFLAELHR